MQIEPQEDALLNALKVISLSILPKDAVKLVHLVSMLIRLSGFVFSIAQSGRITIRHLLVHVYSNARQLLLLPISLILTILVSILTQPLTSLDALQNIGLIQTIILASRFVLTLTSLIRLSTSVSRTVLLELLQTKLIGFARDLAREFLNNTHCNLLQEYASNFVLILILQTIAPISVYLDAQILLHLL